MCRKLHLIREYGASIGSSHIGVKVANPTTPDIGTGVKLGDTCVRVDIVGSVIRTVNAKCPCSRIRFRSAKSSRSPMNALWLGGR